MKTNVINLKVHKGKKRLVSYYSIECSNVTIHRCAGQLLAAECTCSVGRTRRSGQEGYGDARILPSGSISGPPVQGRQVDNSPG